MYGRVTNPQRFAPLHDMAAEILRQLELTFDVEKRQGYGVDKELETRCQLARPTIALEPKDARAAPIAFVFSTFPGLLVRFGKWYTTAFPVCGCDACAETVAGEAERLRTRLDDVISGRFKEAIRYSDSRTARVESEFWSGNGRSTERGWAKLDGMQDIVEGPRESNYVWAAWPRRP